MLSFQAKGVSKMKNQLFVAMMLMASLLFITTGASAQYCSECTYKGAAAMTAQQSNQELTRPAFGEHFRGQEFMPAAATQEGNAEMTAAGAKEITGEQDVRWNSDHYSEGHKLCGYCDLFNRPGLP
jgi:hypothetical protein